LLLGRERPELAFQGANDPGVDPVELRVSALANAHPPSERGKAEGEQGILDDLDVAGRRRTRDLGTASEARDVHGLAVNERRDRQEAGKARKVSDKSLDLDLLSRPDHRERTDRERHIQIERAAELSGHDGMEPAAKRAAGQPIRAVLLQLPGARSAQDESKATLLDEPMDLVEQLRPALDLVHDDGGPHRQRPEFVGEERHASRRGT
jgi:hypothetical protein